MELLCNPEIGKYNVWRFMFIMTASLSLRPVVGTPKGDAKVAFVV